MQQLSDPGVPDLVIGIPVGYCGMNILAEIKSDTGKLTPAQQSFFNVWGGQVDVLRTIKDAKKLLRKYMPIRTYHCPKCGLIDVRQSFKEDSLEKCPECGAEVTQKFYPPPVFYSGGGWGGKEKKPSINENSEQKS